MSHPALSISDDRQGKAVPALAADGLDGRGAEAWLCSNAVEKTPDALNVRISTLAVHDSAVAHDIVADDHRAGA